MYLPVATPNRTTNIYNFPRSVQYGKKIVDTPATIMQQLYNEGPVRGLIWLSVANITLPAEDEIPNTIINDETSDSEKPCAVVKSGRKARGTQ